ncbi:MAG: hypothetical protein ACXQT4_01665 [Methanotrichaceae archaeon]
MEKKENQTHGKPDRVRLGYYCGRKNQTKNQTNSYGQSRQGKPGAGEEKGLMDQQNQTNQTRRKPDEIPLIRGNAVFMGVLRKTRHRVWNFITSIAENLMKRRFQYKPDVYDYQNQAKDSFYERESFCLNASQKKKEGGHNAGSNIRSTRFLSDYFCRG